jgi:hypothetical protein
MLPLKKKGAITNFAIFETPTLSGGVTEVDRTY